MKKFILKYFIILLYYLIIFATFLLVLWIIWVKFLRVRLVKNIPMMLTEYGFWVLFYMCIIYFFIVIVILNSLYKQKTNKINEKNVMKELLNQIYTPFIILDHALKYNKYVINSYYNSMTLIINNLNKFTEKHFIRIILIFQIIPRLILVVFLIMDTFYFHKLEILYKVILLGLFPFIFRYIKYNFNDFKENYIKILESKYKYVFVLDEASSENPNWELNDNNRFHDQDISIKEYISFKIKQHLHGIPSVVYNENPIVHDYVYIQYKKTNNIPEDIELSDKDLKKIHQDFKTYLNIICDSAAIHEKISHSQNKKIILYLRLFIYISYLTCWSYILFISFYEYPINLSMFKYLFENITNYIQEYDLDPFSMINQFSKNKNLITPESICNLISNIYYKKGV